MRNWNLDKQMQYVCKYSTVHTHYAQTYISYNSVGKLANHVKSLMAEETFLLLGECNSEFYYLLL